MVGTSWGSGVVRSGDASPVKQGQRRPRRCQTRSCGFTVRLGLQGGRPADWALFAGAFIFLAVAQLPPWLVVAGFAVATGVFLG